ncbi:unnamed protein product [Parnassius apollo]|uniref:(apollo) hypothetical protein n=1 Tax=Parnassius apollo TaxID=110799 RepID=A0A8S3X0C6_PARAO|nr:unnamed protein product [Parnassius apollo]
MQPAKCSIYNMPRIIYFAVFALGSVQASEQKCEGVTINGVIYEKETLKTGLDSPYQFSINYNTNNIFFSYSTNTKDQRFQLAYINLKTKEFNTITTITDGFASAVDLENNKVFLGSKGGIYDFDLKSKTTSHLGARNHNIWQMFYKDEFISRHSVQQYASSYGNMSRKEETDRKVFKENYDMHEEED